MKLFLSSCPSPSVLALFLDYLPHRSLSTKWLCGMCLYLSLSLWPECDSYELCSWGVWVSTRFGLPFIVFGKPSGVDTYYMHLMTKVLVWHSLIHQAWGNDTYVMTLHLHGWLSYLCVMISWHSLGLKQLM
jgi:hypothetical protein